jgi:hypothetical protein
MKRIVRLNESDLARIVRRVISEQETSFVGRFRDEYNKFTQMVKGGPPKPNNGAKAFQLIKAGIEVWGGTDEDKIKSGVFTIKNQADYDACLMLTNKSAGYPTIMKYIATDMDYDFDRGETTGGGMDWADSNPMLDDWSNHLRKFNTKEVPA